MIALDALHQLTVPQWHQEMLDEREALVAEGTAKYVDWYIVKREILEEVTTS
jgi:hypothetical protein